MGSIINCMGQGSVQMQNKEDWKLFQNEQLEENPTKDSSCEQTVSLEALAKLTGFPAKHIKAELFLGEMKEDEPISLEKIT